MEQPFLSAEGRSDQGWTQRGRRSRFPHFVAVKNSAVSVEAGLTMVFLPASSIFSKNITNRVVLAGSLILETELRTWNRVKLNSQVY